MGRSARLADPDISRGDALLGGALSSALLIWRNPAIVGALTATGVAFAFVSANALWNQPHPHRNAFFATRTPQAAPNPDETVIRIERQPARVDPVVQHIQGALGDLGLYLGSADGVAGPRTRTAIERYQKIVGLPVTGEIDPATIARLGGLPEGIAPKPRKVELAAAPKPAAGAVPKPAAGAVPREVASDVQPLTVDELIRSANESAAPMQTASIETPVPAAQPDPEVMKLQAGLKAFGNDGIEIDGLLGARTRTAIREFQALFGLPETGLPDAALYAKMRDTGLTN